MAVKRLMTEKRRSEKRNIRDLKNKSIDDLTLPDIKRLVAYLARKEGILS